MAFARADPAGTQPDTVYRFGGQRGAFPGEYTVKDFYALDLDTATWTRLTSPQTPSPRANPLLIPGPCAGCVSLLGGRGVFDGVDRMFPEMLTYRETSGRWARVPSEGVGDPFAIRRAAGVIVEVPNANDPQQKTYYAFGGLGNTLFTPDGLRNDVAVYGRETGWRLVKTSGAQPVPRVWTAGVYDPARNSILIFGGYRLSPDPQGGFSGPDNFENDLWSLSLDTFTWTRLQPQGPLPSPRDNSTLFFDTAHGWLVLFGGQGFDRVSNDLWYYSVAENRWTQVILPATAQAPRGRVGGTSFVRIARVAHASSAHGHGGAAEGVRARFWLSIGRSCFARNSALIPSASRSCWKRSELVASPSRPVLLRSGCPTPMTSLFWRSHWQVEPSVWSQATSSIIPPMHGMASKGSRPGPSSSSIESSSGRTGLGASREPNP